MIETYIRYIFASFWPWASCFLWSACATHNNRFHRPPSELAQRKRVGLITQRSYDRNIHSLHFFEFLANKKKTLWQVRKERPKKKVLPGIEPGFRDSESPVITVTLQDLLAAFDQRCVFDVWTDEKVGSASQGKKIRTPGGDRTRDPRLIRPVLYR